MLACGRQRSTDHPVAGTWPLLGTRNGFRGDPALGGRKNNSRDPYGKVDDRRVALQRVTVNAMVASVRTGCSEHRE